MTTLEKVAKAIEEKLDSLPLTRVAGDIQPQYMALSRAAIEALRTPGTENTDRIFNVMLDRILKEEV